MDKIKIYAVDLELKDKLLFTYPKEETLSREMIEKLVAESGYFHYEMNTGNPEETEVVTIDDETMWRYYKSPFS